MHGNRAYKKINKLKLSYPKTDSNSVTFDLLEFKLLQEKKTVLVALEDKLSIKIYYELKNNELQ